MPTPRSSRPRRTSRLGKAALETARINLAYTKVTAPISGRIGRSTVTDGALVTASQPAALATIQQLGSMYVDVTQSSAELLRLKQNLASGLMKKSGAAQARVKLLLEDGSAYPLPGTLKFSEVTVDQSTGSVTLRAIFPNPKQTLLPGMFVRAIVEEGVNEQRHPRSAAGRDPQPERRRHGHGGWGRGEGGAASNQGRPDGRRQLAGQRRTESR